MADKMTVSELIDELLAFEMTDTVDYLNMQIGTGPAKWDLTKTCFGEFRKWTEASDEIAPERAGVGAGASPDQSRLT
jgi:hypothetical protein